MPLTLLEELQLHSERGGCVGFGVYESGTMLARGLGRRLLVLARLAQSSQGASSAALVDLSSGYTTKEDRVVSDGGMALSPSSSFSRSWHFSRGRFLMRLFSRVLAWTKAVQL